MPNIPYIKIQMTGYGHWRITTSYYGKEISTITTDSCSIDDYNCDDFQKDGRELRKKRGALSLRSEIIRKNKY